MIRIINKEKEENKNKIILANILFFQNAKPFYPKNMRKEKEKSNENIEKKQ